MLDLLSPNVDLLIKKQYLIETKSIVINNSHYGAIYDLLNEMQEIIDEILSSKDLNTSIEKNILEYFKIGLQAIGEIKKDEKLFAEITNSQTPIKLDDVVPSSYREKIQNYTKVFEKEFSGFFKKVKRDYNKISFNENISRDMRVIALNQCKWLMIIDCIYTDYSKQKSKLEILCEAYIILAKKQSTLFNELLREWDIILNPVLSNKINNYCKRRKAGQIKTKSSEEVFAQLGI